LPEGIGFNSHKHMVGHPKTEFSAKNKTV
jgi:hypothetical protein